MKTLESPELSQKLAETDDLEGSGGPPAGGRLWPGGVALRDLLLLLFGEHRNGVAHDRFNRIVQQVSLFARHFSKSPELLAFEEIRSYQVYLTNEKKLAPSSILIAVSALRFLYEVIL
jgi:hypothetical protein